MPAVSHNVGLGHPGGGGARNEASAERVAGEARGVEGLGQLAVPLGDRGRLRRSDRALDDQCDALWAEPAGKNTAMAGDGAENGLPVIAAASSHPVSARTGQVFGLVP